MSKKFIKRGILWFFGHIVFSTGLMLVTSDEFKMEFLHGIQEGTPEWNTTTNICTGVGIALVVLGIVMIVPFVIMVCKKLPFFAYKTVKGAGKVVRKIGAGAANSVDRQDEEDGLIRLQKKHGIIKDDKEKSKGSTSNDDTIEYYEYELVDVPEAEVRSAMHSVSKSATDSNLAKVLLDRYTIKKNSDKSYDIDIYLSCRLYGTYMIDDYGAHQAAVERLAQEIVDDVADRVGSLGCGLRVIPHMQE